MFVKTIAQLSLHYVQITKYITITSVELCTYFTLRHTLHALSSMATRHMYMYVKYRVPLNKCNIPNICGLLWQKPNKSSTHY